MSKSQKGIWIGEKDLNKDPDFILDAQSEVQNSSLLEKLGESDLPANSQGSRRDFLKFLGFGLGAATMAAGCDIPVKRAIPYVVKPDEIVPGVASYYASSFVDRGDFCSILVKTREGRPIKIEGNDLSPITKGGTSARAQASVLSLYDVDRLRNPAKNFGDGRGFRKIDWESLDSEIISALQSAKGIRILTNTNISPTGNKALKEFTTKYSSAKVVNYDPVSYAAILKANEQSFGDRSIPNYHFDKAEIIVSFDADFLGTWLSPVEFANQYAEKRKIKDSAEPNMSRHFQIENRMSLTGSNADNRILVKPSEQTAAIAYLYNQLTGANIKSGSLNDKAKEALRKVASQLLAHKSASIIVSGSNEVFAQVLTNAMNEFLENFDSTLDFERASLQKQGDEADLEELISEMERGDVDMILINDANPVFDSVLGVDFAKSLENVATKVAINYKASETSALCNYIVPTHHYLESWGDAEPKRGILSLIQPAISPLFSTRQSELSWLTWSESTTVDLTQEQPYHEYLKSHWESNYFTQQSTESDFQRFWDSVLHDGLLIIASSLEEKSFHADVKALASGYTFNSGSELEIGFYEPVGVGNGQYSNNPWLQELPDPITRCVWGNHLAVPVGFDGVRTFVGLNNLKDGDLVDLTVGDKTIRVPVIQQFGQMKGTVSLALGYGRVNGGFAANGVGSDVNPLLGKNADGLTQYFSTNVSVSDKKGKEEDFACVQYHHTMGVKGTDKKTGETINADEAATVYATYGLVSQGIQGSLTKRSVIRKAHANHLEETVNELVHEREHFEELNQHTLYPFEKYSSELYSQGHHWGLHVDLNACTGCGACVVACMAENNIPVVGKHQVHRHQEMTWLRIDRYYYGDAENPKTVYQPLMCQHCDNAPCENVCPVNATSHSSEGLNQMTYNRCIGTRYCANNCPFKVRRFNWLDYTTADLFPGNQYAINGEEEVHGSDNLTRMVLNPDVTVRARGVIEKCSFCVQRIQEGKLTAKKDGRPLRDADVRTACQTSCPTGAITFGDRNNKKGELYAKFNSEMNYEVLEEVNTRSSIRYSMRVINSDETLDV